MNTNTIITVAIGLLIAIVLVGPISSTITSQIRVQECSADPGSSRQVGTGAAGTATAAGSPLGVPVRVGTSAATATTYVAGSLCLYPSTVTAPAANAFLAIDTDGATGSNAATAGNLFRAPTPAGALAYDFASSRSIIVLVPLGIVAGLVYWGYSAFTRRQGAM